MPDPRVTVPELLSVQAELLALEPVFHQPAFGTGGPDYDARMVEDYFHVGASGGVYARADVLRTVVERGPTPGEETWTVTDPCCRRLGPDTYALTYALDQAGRRTRRVTLWQRAPAGWQVVYHQGTVVSDGAPA